ncbi:hypothetical protein Dimus_032936 [Dionaea muscipula]
MAAMADWNTLPEGPLIEILERLSSYNQFEAMDMVNHQWRSARKKAKFRSASPQPPLLMLSTVDESLRFYSLIHRRVVRRVDFPARDKTCCCFSSHGWLLTVAEDSSLSLFSPFSLRRISLPDKQSLLDSSHLFVHEFIMSANPSSTDNYYVAIVYGTAAYAGALGIWRAGDDRWRNLRTVDGYLTSVAFYKGELHGLYSFAYVTQLVAYSFRHHDSEIDDRGDRGDGVIMGDESEDGKGVGMTVKVRTVGIFLRGAEQRYLVESDGRLLVVSKRIRMSFTLMGTSILTDGFSVSEVDVKSREVVQVNDLGNRSVFLGHCQPISVEAAMRYGCEANRVYFFDDCMDYEKGQYICVYDLQSGRIERHYTGVQTKGPSQPVWIEACFASVLEDYAFSSLDSVTGQGKRQLCLV